jgi:hypothetical protein
MSKTQINGAPFLEGAQTIIHATSSYTAKNQDDIIDVVGGSLTVTLPANPVYGQCHRIIGSGNNVSVNGNGHSIAGTRNRVLSTTAVDYTFSTTDVWVASCCATGIG